MKDVRSNQVAVESETIANLENTLRAFKNGNVSVNDLNAAFKKAPKSLKW